MKNLLFASLLLSSPVMAQMPVGANMAAQAVLEENNQKLLTQWLEKNKIINKRLIVNTKEYYPNSITLHHFKNTLPTPLKNFHIRILAPDSVGTADYSTERLNIMLNKEKKIIEVSIG